MIKLSNIIEGIILLVPLAVAIVWLVIYNPSASELAWAMVTMIVLAKLVMDTSSLIRNRASSNTSYVPCFIAILLGAMVLVMPYFISNTVPLQVRWIPLALGLLLLTVIILTRQRATKRQNAYNEE